MLLYRRLLPAAALLAFAVVVLGAWVRLSDAGLGCPDWPGCYGQLLGVPEHAADTGKAWKEMLHRYLAGTLGLLIFAIAGAAWRQRGRVSPLLPLLLAGIVVFQALLGMWTVTLRLRPLVVSAHLIGGMATFSLLLWLNLKAMAAGGPKAAPAPLRTAALLTLLLVLAQIALGGWVSSNYAALACPDFPTCQGEWLPPMQFAPAFSLHRELGLDAGGQPLTPWALVAIHWSHRLGAGLVALAAGSLGVALLARAGRRRWGLLLLSALALQVAVGVGNVVLLLPLPLAVAHNAGAALLLATTVAVNFHLWRGEARGGDKEAMGESGAHGQDRTADLSLTKGVLYH